MAAPKYFNNANIDVTENNKEITFYSIPGTSTETDIYLALDIMPKKVSIANDKAFVVVAINGVEFRNPKTITAGIGFTMETTAYTGISSVKIRTSDTNSHIEVMMW